MTAKPTTSEILKSTVEVMAKYGWAPVREDECVLVREMAAELIGPDVASAETLLAVRRLQAASCLGFHENGRITGVLGYLFLGRSALDDMMAGRFDALKLDVGRLSAADEPPALGYTWGIAAVSKNASAAAYAAAAELRADLWRDLPFVTRAVTPVGRHIAITRGQYTPLRFPDDEFMIRRPAAVQEIAA
jgi:hypothetical protein